MLLDYFIHKKNMEVDFVRFRSRALVGLYLLSIFFILLTLILWFSLKIHINVTIEITLFLLFVSLFIFKYIGNHVLSANILSATTFVTFSTMIFDSGGLFSDDCIWLTFAPIIALFFGERKFGIFWLVAVLSFNFYLFFNGIYKKEYVEHLLFNPAYYLIGNTTFQGFLFFLCFIFKSEKRVVIQTISNQNIELERKNVEIAKQSELIVEAQQRLKESNEELEQFAYVASHDLKEPLRMITLYTQMIKRKIKDQLDSETGEFMGYVVDGTKRMQQLLDDLLEYSRLGKKGNITQVDLNDVMLVAQQNLKLPIVTNHVEISIDKLPVINAIFSESVQLFQNLIGNAIKFRKNEENPIISIKIKSITNDHFTVQITDNGIGMEEVGMEKIFNLFERLHTRDQYEGTGIGLATCKKVMENLGGTISATSVFGEGTTFFLTFPTKILQEKV
jgi:signal transduction histidine kinase